MTMRYISLKIVHWRAIYVSEREVWPKERQIDRNEWKRVPEWSRLMEESRWIGIIIVLQSRDLSLMPICYEHVTTRRGNRFSILLHWNSNVNRIKLNILRFYNLYKIDKNLNKNWNFITNLKIIIKNYYYWISLW